jgi:hypothetical protein
MKLAFRKTNAPGFFKALFSRYTRWSIKSAYPHGGVIIGGKLWDTTKDGMVITDLENHQDWDLFETPVSDKIATFRLEQVASMEYDHFTMLGIKLPFRITDRKRLNCFERMWVALTGENPGAQITPDALMAELLRMINEKGTTPNLPVDCGNDSNGALHNPGGRAFATGNAEHNLPAGVDADYVSRSSLRLQG